jgi:type II secretory pathway pseudopilin PulG
MVVVGVIAVLVSILLVAFGAVRTSAQQTIAQRLVTTVGNAVESFEREVGYLPPLLVYDKDPGGRILLGNQPPINDNDPSLAVPEAKYPEVSQASLLREELEGTRWGSEFTLPAYLIGTGDIDNSETPGTGTVGRNDANDDGQAGPGIRDPGADRSWGGGGSNGRELQRTERTSIKIGRVYGPYLDPAQLTDHLKLDVKTGMFKLTDTWGQPLRYYKGWARESRNAPIKESIDHTPVELRTAEALEFQINDLQQRADLSLERPIFAARFMVLSAGRPVRFGDGDEPIPLFGDRVIDGSTSASDLGGLPSIQDLSAPFNPGTLGSSPEGDSVRDWLLKNLKSNLRYVP